MENISQLLVSGFPAPNYDDLNGTYKRLDEKTFEMTSPTPGDWLIREQEHGVFVVTQPGMLALPIAQTTGHLFGTWFVKTRQHWNPAKSVHVKPIRDSIDFPDHITISGSFHLTEMNGLFELNEFILEDKPVYSKCSNKHLCIVYVDNHWCVYHLQSMIMTQDSLLQLSEDWVNRGDPPGCDEVSTSLSPDFRHSWSLSSFASDEGEDLPLYAGEVLLAWLPTNQPDLFDPSQSWSVQQAGTILQDDTLECKEYRESPDSVTLFISLCVDSVILLSDLRVEVPKQPFTFADISESLLEQELFSPLNCTVQKIQTSTKFKKSWLCPSLTDALDYKRNHLVYHLTVKMSIHESFTICGCRSDPELNGTYVPTTSSRNGRVQYTHLLRNHLTLYWEGNLREGQWVLFDNKEASILTVNKENVSSPRKSKQVWIVRGAVDPWFTVTPSELPTNDETPTPECVVLDKSFHHNINSEMNGMYHKTSLKNDRPLYCSECSKKTLFWEAENARWCLTVGSELIARLPWDVPFPGCVAGCFWQVMDPSLKKFVEDPHIKAFPGLLEACQIEA